MNGHSSRRYLGLTGQDWIDALTAGAAFLLGRFAAAQRNAEDAYVNELEAAASLLGVEHDADETEIRSAFRAKMKVRENLDSHPDRGGAGDMALRLINAKNLLLAYARSLKETST